jgi:hypothetical protein
MRYDDLPVHDPCPHCGEEITDVPEYTGKFQDDRPGEYSVQFVCPHCRGPIKAKIEVTERVEYDYEVDLETNGEAPKPEPPSVEEVNRFFSKKPSLVMFDEDHACCEVCGKQACPGGCNAQHLISQGWKVVPDYPDYHIQCPECR